MQKIPTLLEIHLAVIYYNYDNVWSGLNGKSIIVNGIFRMAWDIHWNVLNLLHKRWCFKTADFQCKKSLLVDVGQGPIVRPQPCSHLLFACWVIFSNIFFFQKMQKLIVSSQIFCWYIIWMSNNLDLRWSPTFCGASSGSKLFAKVINGLQNSPLAG